MKQIGALVAALALSLLACQCAAQDGAAAPHTMELPSEIRTWFRNPDGTCDQCTLGMCGVGQNAPRATTLLWDTPYGPRVRGGSWPSRVEAYAQRREIPVYNVTGSTTFQWMEWAARTHRFAAIGAGTRHFQTLYGFDPATRTWFVCNNNSPGRIDRYTQEQFERLHLASGRWCVVIDRPPSPAVPVYTAWWQ